MAQLCVLNIFVNGFVPVTHLLAPVATRLLVKCPQGCDVQVKDFTKHVAQRSEVCMGVASSSEVCMGSRNPALIVQDILRKPLGHPITTTERNVAGYSIKK